MLNHAPQKKIQSPVVYYLLMFMIISGVVLISYYISTIIYVIFNPAIPYPENYDYYYLYEGARNFIKDGVPTILYWPNSSSGLDIFAWDKVSQIISYAGFLNIYGMQIENIFIFDALLKVLSIIFLVSSVYLLTRNWMYVGIVVSLLFIDPVSRFFLINKQYYGLAWGALCFNFVIFVKYAHFPKVNLVAALLSGLTVPILFFWFLPMGVYYLVSIVLYLSISVFITKKYKAYYKFTMFYILAALFSTTVFLIVYAQFANLPVFINSFSDAINIHVLYNETVPFVRARILFILNTIFPSQGFSLVPVILVIILRIYFDAIRFRNKFLLNDNILRAAVACVLGYLSMGILAPDNFYLARMSWALPIVFYVFFRIIMLDEAVYYQKLTFQYVLAYSVGFLTYVIIDKLYTTPLAWVIGLSSILLVYFVLYRTVNHNQENVFGKKWLVIFIPFALSLWPAIENVISYSNRYYRGNIEPVAEIIKNNSDNGYVVSNFVLSAYSPETNVHLVQSYKGLINGAMPQPGYSFLYFVKNRDLQNTTCKGAGFQYGLHVYVGKRLVKVNDDYSVCEGYFAKKKDFDGSITVLDTLSDDKIKKYFLSRFK